MVELQQFPLLREAGPARQATESRPAAGAVYTTTINNGIPPVMPSGKTLYELFRCAVITPDSMHTFMSCPRLPMHTPTCSDRWWLAAWVAASTGAACGDGAGQSPWAWGLSCLHA